MILTVPEHCTLEMSAAITTMFANEFELYSPSLFATYDRMIANHALQKRVAPLLEEFFSFVNCG